MLGKTNILFVSKSDASETQLVQEKYLTPSAGNIRKIECLNNMLFAYTDDKEVLFGSDVRALSFIKKDGENLVATHFIYHRGKYYFCNSYADKQEKAIIYVTEDCMNFEEIVIEEDVYLNETNKALFSVPGIFKDSQERIIVMIREIVPSGASHKLSIYIFDTLEELSNKDVVVCDNATLADSHAEYSRLLKDRILNGGNMCDLAGNTHYLEYDIVSYANDYFFYTAVSQNKKTAIYKSFNGQDWSKCSSFSIDDAWELRRAVYNNRAYPDILPMCGEIGLIYRDSQEKCYINIAENVREIGNSANETFEIDMPGYVCSVAEDENGNTYIGCSGGIIIKCYCDSDGSTKLPDVQLVKTLAAKQALEQAKRYTDEKVAELRAYLDSNEKQ